MNKFFKKIILLNFLFLISINFLSAQGGILRDGGEEPGCEREDRFLPTLVICGRNPATGACQAYTKQCNLGDLVETGRRVLVWIITIAILILPIVIAYYGFRMMWEHEFPTGGAKWGELKQKFYMFIIYLVCLLGAWIIVRTIVDVTRVNPRINTFLIENGEQVKARPVDFTR